MNKGRCSRRVSGGRGPRRRHLADEGLESDSSTWPACGNGNGSWLSALNLHAGKSRVNKLDKSLLFKKNISVMGISCFVLQNNIMGNDDILPQEVVAQWFVEITLEIV